MKIKVRNMKAGLRDIDDLEEFQGSLKDLPKEEFEKLKTVIETKGFSAPFFVWAGTNKLLDGHQRLRTLRTLKSVGYEIPKLPVLEIEADTEKEAQELLLGFATVYGLTNEDGLLEFLTNAQIDLDFAKDTFRMPDMRWDEFFESNGPTASFDSEHEDDVPEPPKEPKTRLGDIYRLGNHRLMCGDSTSIDALDALMQGEKADLWLTDPPYGVGYKSNGSEDKHGAIANDDLPMDDMKEFWRTASSNALLSCSDKAAYYWFACQGGDQMMMMMSLGDAGWKVRHELIWVKDSLVMGRCDYHYKHEPILYGWKKDGTHSWFSDRKQTSVLEFPRPKRSDDHPTMKPVALVEYLIGNNTRPGQIVLDTFGGSGTTLIAAEKSGRAARLIELSPRYCDVIVRRFEELTGQKAELLPV